MIRDNELLQAFHESGDQEAFAELVRRHLDIVYNVALRALGGDSSLAEEATQDVFSDLARKASELRDRSTLGGWLYHASRYRSIDLLRKEVRRKRREERAVEMEGSDSFDWSELSPLLDELVDGLPEKYRDVVCLRFFEGLGYAEVSIRIGIGEDGARKRVDRAVAFLEKRLVKRGIYSSATAIAAGLSGQVVVTAPTQVLRSAVERGLAGGSAPNAVQHVKSGIHILNANRLGLVLGAGLCIAAVFTYQYQANRLEAAKVEWIESRKNLEELSARRIGLEMELQQLEQQETESTNRRSAGSASDELGESGIRLLTPERVHEIFQRSRELHEHGYYEAALRGYLWCFEKGMPRFPQFIGIRLDVLLEDMVRLSEDHPEAEAALLRISEKDLAKVIANPAAIPELIEWTAINKAMGWAETTAEIYEELPHGDPRRKMLKTWLRDYLIEKQRYEEIHSITSPQQMFATLELLRGSETLEERRPNGNPDRIRGQAIEIATQDIEILAGTGQLEEAVQLGAVFLAYYGSQETRNLLESRLERTGQSKLYRLIMVRSETGFKSEKTAD